MEHERSSENVRVVMNRPLARWSWMRRDILSLALMSGLCLLDSSGNTAFSGQNDVAKSPQKTLAIMNKYNVPIAELSGLAIVRASAGKNEDKINLYGIGDASYEIANFRIHADPDDASVQPDSRRVQDVAHIIGRHTKDSSQWEAIAFDGKDTLCMLSETRGEITCLDRGLQNDLGSFSLDVSSIGSLDSAWEAHPNSRGEGMILMKKGHVLVLKEKQPSMLIEFGPEGDAPMGYGPDTFLQKGDKFIVPQPGSPGRPSRLVALKAWEFSKSLRGLASDASEITLGPDGRIYLLSQESSTLIRLQKILKTDEDKAGLDQDAYWNLPAGLEKAEGLIIDDDMHPWVGIDIKQASKHNLFRLSPIDMDARAPE